MALPFDPAALVSFAEPWDGTKVQMLDHVISTMYSGNEGQRRIAHDVLNQVKVHPDAWQVVDTILSTSQSPDTKFFSLNLLENVICTRWLVLPEGQRSGIKNYVVQLVIKIAADDQLATQQRHFLTKLNETLIHIVKQEWPHAWENFIPDICGSSRTNQSLCENNLRILNLLSEEVFAFGKSGMVSRKVSKLKEILNSQFATIYELCDFIFKTHISSPGAVKNSLLTTTLSTLSNFLDWIPLGYIFETDLIQTLLFHFWDPLEYRIECVKCLNEIACLHEGVQQYQPHIVRCFQGVSEKIQQLPDFSPQAFASLPGPQRVFWEVFHNQTALMLTGFLKHNMAAMEAQAQCMLPALTYLVRISMGPNDETFKICVEFWQTFAARLFYLEVQQRRGGQMSLTAGASPLLMDGVAHGGGPSAAADPKLKLYAPVLAEVRQVLISKMVKPPEVTIKENEEGRIVRAEEEDTDELALYKMMREALIYLTHLNPENTESTMLNRLTQECLTVDGGTQEQWSFTQLNRLCWAIGSISGAMQETDEKRFLVSVIKDLLSLCEMKRGKENKAVVASNIMYVVGQYPRFLRAHWKFLKTVIHKLIEFMHETFPGVQEMAVDTFLKICQKCKKKFVQLQRDEQVPFVEELMTHVAQDISELEHLHICTYFEAVGYMISAASADGKAILVDSLMRLFNEKWAAILRSLATVGPQEAFKDQQMLREISLTLRVNERVLSAVGPAFHTQLGLIYNDMLKIYKVCSEFITHSIAQNGPQVTGFAHIRLMRNVKRGTLHLVQTFVEKAAVEQDVAEAGLNAAELAGRFVPPLLEPVLADYKNSLPQARDAEVLDLLATLAAKLSGSISSEIPRIFDMVFECTLDMIKGDFQSFPDHRTKFYELLKAVNSHCFQALFTLPEQQLRLYVDSLVWAAKHEQPQVADSGLQIITQFLERLLAGPPQIYIGFFKQYYLSLLQDILSVLTDTLHKPGLQLQQTILMQLISAVASGKLAEADLPKQRAMECLYGLIGKSFPSLHEKQVEIFVLNCFNKCASPAEFQQHVRDFLIQLREWGSHEEALYEPERQEALNNQQTATATWQKQIPGLVPQHDPSRKDEGMDEL